MLVYESTTFGSFRKAYLAMMKESGLREPNAQEMRIINAVKASQTEPMRETYEFLKTKLVWCTGVKADKNGNVSYFSNQTAIVTPL